MKFKSKLPKPEAVTDRRQSEPRQSHGKSVPVGSRSKIAGTANIFPADRQRGFDAGMNSYLNKPVKMAALAAMLTEAGDHAAGHPDHQPIISR